MWSQLLFHSSANAHLEGLVDPSEVWFGLFNLSISGARACPKMKSPNQKKANEGGARSEWVEHFGVGPSSGSCPPNLADSHGEDSPGPEESEKTATNVRPRPHVWFPESHDRGSTRDGADSDDLEQERLVAHRLVSLGRTLIVYAQVSLIPHWACLRRESAWRGRWRGSVSALRRARLALRASNPLLTSSCQVNLP